MKMFKEAARRIRRELEKGAIGYLSAAFAFVAGLAWNDAVRSLIDLVFPGQQNSVIAKFGYALFVTLVLALVTIALARIADRARREEEKKQQENAQQ